MASIVLQDAPSGVVLLSPSYYFLCSVVHRSSHEGFGSSDIEQINMDIQSINIRYLTYQYLILNLRSSAKVQILISGYLIYKYPILNFLISDINLKYRIFNLISLGFQMEGAVAPPFVSGLLCSSRKALAKRGGAH